jgi:molybdopterin-containing oxidoreductase family membrane subunit
MYTPTKWDWGTYAGTIGFFMLLIFLFVRLLPAISIFEERETLHHEKRHAGHAVQEPV